MNAYYNIIPIVHVLCSFYLDWALLHANQVDLAHLNFRHEPTLTCSQIMDSVAAWALKLFILFL